MTDLTNWKAPPFPPAKVLDGRYCRLEPLDVARHGADIAAAFERWLAPENFDAQGRQKVSLASLNKAAA